MLFNSFFYILLFLPIVFFTYFLLAPRSHRLAKLFLVAASIFFYGWWDVQYIKLLFISIIVNYGVAWCLNLINFKSIRKSLLLLGIFFNVALLGYFKYSHFFVSNVNLVFNTNWDIATIVLPLGISFFTFTQTAFLVDTYRQPTKQYGLIDYSLFVSYFPHLLAGPIIHHATVMPQFNDKQNAIINYKNIYFGLMLFVIGLFKKVVIADTFAIFANLGYEQVADLGFLSAWATSLAYTLQLYFDFSGYTDMAIGVSRMLNIELPLNFNSPYQATNIRDFWHRWHMTLSDFLRDYIYIPLGGNRISPLRTYANLFATFLIGGIWHGAGWTYIIWGMLHGFALCVHRLFATLNIKLSRFISWLMTFMFVNIAWIFFRAETLPDALHVLFTMFNTTAIAPINYREFLLLALGLMIVTKEPPSHDIIKMKIMDQRKFTPILASVFFLSIFAMEISNSHAFIYFQF